MKTYTLPKTWAYALHKPHDLPNHLCGKELNDWLDLHTPTHAQELPVDVPFLTQQDRQYPSELLGTGAPPVLFYKGNLERLHNNIVAVVGTRKCSTLGIEFTKKISRFLRDHETTSISGLAYGIDEIVHKEAPSHTIGVMPCGFGATLPSRTQAICDQILQEGGLLLSEFPPHSPPRKWRFIQRNRIIAWLAQALILVEAPTQSGALHTVDFAQQRDKKIWIVPSSPLTHSNQGGLQLIAAGFDVLSHLQQVGQYLGYQTKIQAPETIMSFSELANHLNMNTKQAMRALAQLEIEGKITSLPNGYFSWTPSYSH